MNASGLCRGTVGGVRGSGGDAGGSDLRGVRAQVECVEEVGSGAAVSFFSLLL